jgi:hypothetical protein
VLDGIIRTFTPAIGITADVVLSRKTSRSHLPQLRKLLFDLLNPSL